MVDGRRGGEEIRKVSINAPSGSRPGTSPQARSTFRRCQSSKKSASGLVDALISSFAGNSVPRSSSPVAAEATGSISSSALWSSSPRSGACGTKSRSASPRDEAGAPAAMASCSYAGGTSVSAPVTPSTRSFTEPGLLSIPSKRSLSSSRPLLPDAVFLPDSISSAGTPSKPYYKPAGTSSISFLPDAVHMGPADPSSSADCEHEAGPGSSRSNGLAAFTGSFADFASCSGSNAGSGPATGSQLHRLGSTSFLSSAAGGSSNPTDPPARQKSRVSFLIKEHSCSSPTGSSTSTANSSTSGSGQAAMASSRSIQLPIDLEVALDEVATQHAADFKRSKTTALTEIQEQAAGSVMSGSGGSNGGGAAKPRLAGLTLVLHKLTAVMDGSHKRDTSEADADGLAMDSSTDGAKTPGGSSKAKMLAYKHQIGYLPSPSTSSGGSLSRGLSQKSNKSPVGSALSRAGSMKQDAAAAAEAAAGSKSLQAVLPEMSESQAAAGLPALPPGVVPVFGGPNSSHPAAACGGHDSVFCSSLYSNSSSICTMSSSGNKADSTAAVAGGSNLQRTLDQVHQATYSMKALNPLLDSAVAAVAAAAAPRQQPSPPLQAVSSVQYGVQHPYMQAPRAQVTLAPASQVEPVLLAVSPRLPPSMQRQCWCLSDFQIQKKLYDGYASSICKAQDRVSGATVALKFYHMSKLNSISSHQVAREVRLHIDLDHENIITLYAAFQEAGSVLLVQDFAPGGDLWAFIDANSGRLTERVTVSLVLQPFLRALQYLHSAGIAHRDIKPENVLFSTNMVLKVADFGLAVNLREERAVTRVGTLDYMAPEVLKCPLKRHPADNKDKPDLSYQQSVDSWAVGVLAYELLTGRAPFSAAGASDAAIEIAIKTAAPSFPSRMSEPARDFIAVALNKAPDKRPSILHMLQHPWIRSFQRSSSNGRAERRSSQELGGEGRFLMAAPHHAGMPPASAPPAGMPSAIAAVKQQLQQQQAQRPQSPQSPTLQPLQHQGLLPTLRSQGTSKLDLFTAGGGGGATATASTVAAAAAARVFRSDDLGITGYALADGGL